MLFSCFPIVGEEDGSGLFFQQGPELRGGLGNQLDETELEIRGGVAEQAGEIVHHLLAVVPGTEHLALSGPQPGLVTAVLPTDGEDDGIRNRDTVNFVITYAAALQTDLCTELRLDQAEELAKRLDLLTDQFYHLPSRRSIYR